jgi:hypothetical protein
MNHLEKINTYNFTLLCHFPNFSSPWRILILASFISLSTRSRSRSNQSARNFVVVGVLARLGEAKRGEAVVVLGREVEALGVLREAVRMEKSIWLRVLSNSSSSLIPSAKSESMK